MELTSFPVLWHCESPFRCILMMLMVLISLIEVVIIIYWVKVNLINGFRSICQFDKMK